MVLKYKLTWTFKR